MVAEFDSVALAGAVSNFMAWSLSFYPQVLLNHKRRSTEGAAIDFSVANTLGFASYTVYTAVCLWSPTVRAQYAYRHPEAPEQTVRLNDLAFAAHGTVLCIVLYSQYWPAVWGFNVGARQKASRAVLGIMCGSLLGTMAVLSAVWLCGRNGGSDPSGWCWIDVMYALSAIKLIITVYKYTPQVRTNYLQQSTHGWSIWQILLDLTGGVLSFAQLLTDSALQRNWSGITGNPIKVGLAGVSVGFDLIFIVQHYWLYAGGKEKTLDAEEEERRPLLIEGT